MRAVPERLGPAFLVPALVAFAALLVSCEESNAPPSALSESSLGALHDAMAFKFADNPAKAERTELFGISFVAPQGDNWIQEPRRPAPKSDYYGGQVLTRFAKIIRQTTAAPHTVLATIYIYYIPPNLRSLVASKQHEYIRFRMGQAVKEFKETAGRIKTTSVTADADDAMGACFRMDALQEDRGVYGFANVPFVLDVHEYQCVDPSSRFVVEITYSQRTPPDVKPVDLGTEGESFIKSLEFSPPQG